MLWGHTLRSPHAHARIVSIDIAQRRRRCPACTRCSRTRTFPARRRTGSSSPTSRCSRSTASATHGEPVALVAAEHPGAGAARGRGDRRRVRGAARGRPTWSARPSMEPLHPDRPTMGHGYRDDPRPNVVRHIVIRHGDPDAAGDVTVDGRLRGRHPGPGVPRARVGPRGPGRRGRRRHLRRDAVAARRPRPGRAVPRARRPSRCGSTSPGVGGAFGGREDLSIQIHARDARAPHRAGR